MEPWPKLFHNLRASRETELVSEFPIQTACSWLGNSPVVTAKHYLTVREEDSTRAASTAKNAAEGGGNERKRQESEFAAKRKILIEENPFDGVNMPATGIRDRQRFISREDVSKVLDVCPDHH